MSSDILELYAALIRTEDEALWIVRRIANMTGVREAFVLSRRQKHVVNVPISAAFFRSDRMHKYLDIRVRENIRRLPVRNYRVWPHRIAPGQANVLVEQMDKIAVRQVSQESFRISPAVGDAEAVIMRDQVNGMRCMKILRSPS